MIKIEEPLYQWDTNRYVLLDEDSDVNFALVGADHCYTVASENCRAKIPNELLQEGADISVWRYKDDHTLEQDYFGVWQKPKPVDYEDKQEQAIQKRIDDAVAENQKKNDLIIEQSKYKIIDMYFEKSLEEYSNDKVTELDEKAFSDQVKLKKINCPSLNSIGTYCFYNCTSLIDAGDMSNVTTIRNYAFYNCSSLTSLSFSNAVNGGEEGKIGEYVFSKCSNLITIDLPKAKEIDSSCFSYCSSLKEVFFPLMTGKISDNLFSFCYSLTKAMFPSAVTAIKANNRWAAPFYNCFRLQALILKSPTLINLQSNNALIGDNAATNVALSPAYTGDNPGYIYVPKALVEDYKTATNWSVFADKFRAIEDYPEICNEGV
jgi:hypothetical protein|nr:MAG TPA_asm: leucine-rich repeat protein [Caudoviricetes sp.]